MDLQPFMFLSHILKYTNTSIIIRYLKIDKIDTAALANSKMSQNLFFKD